MKTYRKLPEFAADYRILKARNLPDAEIAVRMGYQPSSISKLIARARQAGLVAGGRRRPATSEHIEQLGAHIDQFSWPKGVGRPVRTDMLDYPTGWRLAKEGVIHTDRRCSYIQAWGGFLCDCRAIEAEWIRRGGVKYWGRMP
ncbi:hypothetical protein Rhe02_55440 [Rhizocola hellebori]|uniref:Uncharacterized protein n=1 Tax=Rhizocola hellebori TaxID=1392758 RepID=A0A8J3QD64_9ACTN|nr:hypothetical protein [Rhizocola hellebori]GIH07477.1 hypothetical protein Rhe02_55440 [Rhizocola hellebori]